MKKIIKEYPLTFLVIMAIWFLSFFNPPQTEMEEIPFIDKIAHICMYGGFVTVLWFEYFRSHTSLNFKRLIFGGILAPMFMSGLIEILQEYCTAHRGGEWLDLVANCTGVVLGALFSYYVTRPIVWKLFHKKN